MDLFAAYFCFINFGITPRQYDAMDVREKLGIIGFIEVYQQAQEDAQKKAARK